MSFMDLPVVTLPFGERSEQEFFIKYLGFNNFEFIKPIKYFRIQKFYTLHIILEGSGTVKVKDKVYKASKGDMFFIPPGVNLCYYPEEKDQWKYAWFEFLGQNSTLYCEKMGFVNETYVKRCRGFENIVLELGRIFTSRIRNSVIGYYDVLSVFFKILDINIRKSDTQTMVDTVVTYINCNYGNTELSVPEICDRLNISHSYLCRIFKSAYNCSVKSYITRVRINEACRLLETTDLSVKEIAYSVGFSDYVHFMKTFKKHKEHTPTEYRKKYIYSE